jgi:hypothetical protein
MNKLIWSCLLASSLYGYEYGFVGYEFIHPEHPVHVAGRFRQAGQAKLEDGLPGHLRYADASTSAYYTHYLDQNYENSLTLGLGYDYLGLDWKKNPYFKDTDFHYSTLSLGYVTTSIDKWRWVLNTGTTVDSAHMNFGKTGVYHGMAWGRYQYGNKIGVHIGTTGWYGVKNGYILPIFGLDWRPNTDWTINAIFPLNISVAYHIDENWTTEAAFSGFGGPYRYFRRAHEGLGNLKDPIFSLYAKGFDANVKYNLNHLLQVNLGLGWSSGGKILIKNEDNLPHGWHGFKSTVYGQISASFTY